MCRTQNKTGGLAGVALAAVLLLSGWGPFVSSLAAQEKYKVFFKVDPKADEPTELVAANTYPLLRPNTAQPIEFFVQNLSGAAQKTLTVKVVLNGATPRTVAQAELTDVADKVRQRLVFKPVAPAAPPPPPGKERPAEKPSLPPAVFPLAPPTDRDLMGFQLWVQGDAGEPEKKTVPVSLARPPEYVDLVEADLDRDRNRFTATVRLKQGFSGPPCPVELVLLPSQIPGLIPTRTKNGVYRQVLQHEGGRNSAKLVADKLPFREGEKGTGYVYLTVDDYERAFILETTFAGEGVAKPVSVPRRRLEIASTRRYLPPTTRFRVGLEVDGGKDEKVEVALDRERNNTFAEKVTLPWPRDQQISFTIAEDGALAFKTRVRDWSAELDTDGLFGDYEIRAKLLAPRIEGKSEGKDLEATAKVTFDSSPPEIVEFTVASESGGKEVRLRRGRPLELVAKAIDEESGIVEAAFFVGKLSPEGKLPGEPMIDRPPVNKKTGKVGLEKEFEARALVPAPTEKAGTVFVGVQVTNGAGLKSFGELKIILVDDPDKDKKPDGKNGPGDGKAKLGSVAGTVVEGDRPQKGLVVTLRDIKGADVKATTKTDAKGNYLFTDVPPGPYRVFSENPASKTTGSTPAQVEAGKKTEGIDISLLRR